MSPAKKGRNPAPSHVRHPATEKKPARLTALDGLRGLAALSVSLSHIGFQISNIIPSEIAVTAYRTLAVGPNSVQIFFVLSGFLMAYLYPQIPDVLTFIKKRYARIIPILAVAIWYFTLVHVYDYQLAWYQEALALLAPALGIFLFWKGVSHGGKAGFFGGLIFYSFLALQGFMLVFNLVLAPKLMELPLYENVLISGIHAGLSNVTLTMPFIRNTPSFTSVLWSLPPEMYFYVLYPILAIPLLRISRGYPWFVGALLAAGMIKILFDIDEAIRGIYNLRIINISRTSGFVIGMIAGELARSFPNRLSQIFSLWSINVILLGGLILIQLGDWTVRDGSSIWFMNAYYLVSSCIVGLLVLSAVTKGSLIERFFSQKILVFYGMISYSLYLTHSHVTKWVGQIIDPVREIFSTLPQLFSLIEFGIVLGLNIVVSFILYQTVEALYLNRSKHSPSLAAASKRIRILPPLLMKLRIPRFMWSVLSFAVVLFLVLFSYTGGLRLTQRGAHHGYYAAWDYRSCIDPIISLHDNPTVRIPFKALYDNLSVITLDLWYFKNADVTRSRFDHPARLRFRLLDENSQNVLSETWWHAYDIESESNYPFGFETIPDSAGKNYIAELYLEGGTQRDHILFHGGAGKIQTIYTLTKAEVMRAPHTLIMNRVTYLITHPDSLFALGFIGVSALLILRMRKKSS